MRTPGVARVEVQRFGRRSEADANLDVIVIGALEIAELRNDPNNPQHGTIVLQIFEDYERR